MNVKLSAIAMPQAFTNDERLDPKLNYYIRGKVNSKNVKDLMDVVVNAHGHLFKDSKKLDWKELKGKKLSWPFHTPVVLAKNPDPQKGEKLKGPHAKETGKGKKRGKVFKGYELLDGATRMTVWRRLGQKEIPAEIKTVTDPGQRFAIQYRTNAGHGLRLDKDSRDNAVRIFHNAYKWSLNQLAKETGMDRSSITRILADKQRKKGPREKGKGSFVESAGHEAEMSVQGFHERLMSLLSNFPRITPTLRDFLSKVPEQNREKLVTIARQVRDIATLYETVI